MRKWVDGKNVVLKAPWQRYEVMHRESWKMLPEKFQSLPHLESLSDSDLAELTVKFSGWPDKRRLVCNDCGASNKHFAYCRNRKNQDPAPNKTVTHEMRSFFPPTPPHPSPTQPSDEDYFHALDNIEVSMQDSRNPKRHEFSVQEEEEERTLARNEVEEEEESAFVEAVKQNTQVKVVASSGGEEMEVESSSERDGSEGGGFPSYHSDEILSTIDEDCSSSEEDTRGGGHIKSHGRSSGLQRVPRDAEEEVELPFDNEEQSNIETEEEGDSDSSFVDGDRRLSPSIATRKRDELLSQYPTFYNQRPVGDGDYSCLMRTRIPSGIQLAKMGLFRGEDHAYAGLDMLNLDPGLLPIEHVGLRQNSHFLVCQARIWGAGSNGAPAEIDMVCGNHLERGGVRKSIKVLPSLSGSLASLLLVTHTMTCRECKANKSKQELFSSLLDIEVRELRFEGEVECFCTFTVGGRNASGWFPARDFVRSPGGEAALKNMHEKAPKSSASRDLGKVLEQKRRSSFPTSRSVTTSSQEILSQLSDIARHDLGLAVCGKRVIRFVTLTELARPTGPSFGSLLGRIAQGREVAAWDMETKEQQRLRLMLLDLEKRKSTIGHYFGGNVGEVEGEGSCREFVSKFYLSYSSSRRFLVAYTKAQEPLIQSLSISCASGTPSYAIDHVFPTGNRFRKNGGSGTWVMTDAIGRVIVSGLCANKSVKELKPVLEKVKNVQKLDRSLFGGMPKIVERGEGALQVIFTDQPKSDKRTLTSVFEGVSVKGDLLHFFKDLFACVEEGGPWHRTWVRMVAKVAYVFLASDVERLRTYLLATGWDPVRLEAELRNASFLKRHRRWVRVILVSAVVFLTNIRPIITLFQMEGAFNAIKISKALKNLETDVNEVFTLPEGFSHFLNVGTDEEPHFRAVRGTNMTENFNREIQGMRTQQHGPDLFHSNALLLMMRRNVSLSRDVLGAKYIDDVFDLELMCNSFLLSKKCKEKGISCPDVDAVNFTLALPTNLHMSSFASLLNSKQIKIKSSEKHVLRDISARPFSMESSNEGKLAIQMVKSGKYFARPEHYLQFLDEVGNLTQVFWVQVAKTTRSALNLDKLVVEWNKLVEKHSYLEEDVSIRILTARISPSGVRQKEPAHIDAFLSQYASGVMRNMAVENMGLNMEVTPMVGLEAPTLSLSTAPTPIPGTHLLVPSLKVVELPEAHQVNREETLPIPPKTTVMEMPLPPPPLAMELEQLPLVEPRKEEDLSSCPVCGRKKHVTPNQKLCLMYRFYKDETVDKVYAKGDNELSEWQRNVRMWLDDPYIHLTYQ